MEPARLACWGPQGENRGARADALALGGFGSSVSRVWGARGLQVKADENSLEHNVQPKTQLPCDWESQEEGPPPTQKPGGSALGVGWG